MFSKKKQDLDLTQVEQVAAGYTGPSPQEQKKAEAAAKKAEAAEARERKKAEAAARKAEKKAQAAEAAALKAEAQGKQPKAAKQKAAGKPAKAGAGAKQTAAEKLGGYLPNGMLTAKLQQRGNIKLIVGGVFVLVGMLLCMRALGTMTSQQKVTAEEETLLTSLRTEVQALKQQDSELPDISDAIMRSINVDTNVSAAVQNFLRETAEGNGMIVQKFTTFEKRNEANLLKAYYQIEGVAQTSNIVGFLKAVQGYERVMLVDEVYLSEGTRVSLGLETADETSTEAPTASATVVKEFRVVIQDAYARAEVTGGSAPPQAGPPPDTSGDLTVEPTAKVNEAHQHTYGEPGWTKAATHDTDGEQVEICTVCNNVHPIAVPHAEKYHAWGPGKCGTRTCLTDGAREDPEDFEHLFGPWQTVTEATCYVRGYAERDCINPDCDEKEIRELSMLPHRWTTVDGRTICAVCGAAEPTGIPVDVN